jgi:putative endonuclease
VIDRNWRVAEGEIDLVLARAGEIVICEVKSRADDRFGGGAAAVNHIKQRRLRVLAALWLAQRRPSGRVNVRFDVAAVTGVAVEVIEHAF